MDADNRVLLENARLIWRNFAGEERLYNAEGNRNFTLILPEDIGLKMMADGWNVKRLKPRADDEEGDLSLKVKVSYKGRSKPKASIVTLSKNARTPLDEDMIDLLDWAEFETADVILRPYDWEVNGKTGRTAYLSNIVGILREDELELKYAHFVVDGEGGALPELGPGFDFDGEAIEDSGWDTDKPKEIER